MSTLEMASGFLDRETGTYSSQRRRMVSGGGGGGGDDESGFPSLSSSPWLLLLFDIGSSDEGESLSSMSSSEEKADGVVLLPQLRSRPGDETDDAEPYEDSEPAVRNPSSLKRSKAVTPVQLRGFGEMGPGRDDQWGITQSWTNLADALS